MRFEVYCVGMHATGVPNPAKQTCIENRGFLYTSNSTCIENRDFLYTSQPVEVRQ